MKSYASDLPNVEELRPVLEDVSRKVIDGVTERVANIDRENRAVTNVAAGIIQQQIGSVRVDLVAVVENLIAIRTAVAESKAAAKKWKVTLVVLGVIQTVVLSAASAGLFYSMGYWDKLRIILGL